MNKIHRRVPLLYCNLVAGRRKIDNYNLIVSSISRVKFGYYYMRWIAGYNLSFVISLKTSLTGMNQVQRLFIFYYSIESNFYRIMMIIIDDDNNMVLLVFRRFHQCKRLV